MRKPLGMMGWMDELRRQWGLVLSDGEVEK